MEGVHPQHNSIASYGWIKKGTAKQLKTNNGRKRTNINGALNLTSKQVFYVEEERINSQTMIALLLITLKNQKEGKIYIVLDNARYYHSEIVKEFLRDNPRVILKFMPPYSPNLNIIERLWRILKKKVVYNKFYQKFDDFRIPHFLRDPWKSCSQVKYSNVIPTFTRNLLHWKTDSLT